METVHTQPERPSYETFSADLDKINAALKEITQQQKETDRIIKENARRQAETDKRFGEFTNRFGEMVEYMVAPNLLDKFQELGFGYDKVYQNTAITDRKNNIFTEVDITLENGDDVMITEVKTKPTIEDINQHIQRLEKVKAHAALHGKKRKYLGAVAGVVMTPEVKKYILDQGFYAIEPSGETFNITPPSPPKEW